MKRRAFALFLLLPFFGLAQDQLTLTGNIKGLQDGTPVWLIDANRPDTLATAIAQKEAFEFKVLLKEPMLLNMSPGINKTALLFLENNKVKVSGDITALGKLKVTGSPTNKDFNDFQTTFNPLFSKLTQTTQQLNSFGRTDSLMNRYQQLSDSIESAVDVFVPKHKSTAVGAFIIAITMQLKDDIFITEARLNQLDSSALKNMYAAYARQTIDAIKPTAVGAEAMDFTQTDTLGTPVTLSSFRGKYVLLDFWASWCGPCRAENPNVVNSYNKFKNKNFTILSVSLDRPGDKDKWIKAIHTDNLTWTHVSDLQFWSNAVAQQYHIQTIPQNFLIDPKGKIVAKNLRGNELDSKLCEVLGCN